MVTISHNCQVQVLEIQKHQRTLAQNGMEIKKAAKDLYLIPISHNCLVQVLDIQKHQQTFAQKWNGN